jgi:hypothetical protein
MMVETSSTVTVMSRADQARLQLLRAIRSSGLPEKEVLDVVKFAFQRGSRRGVRPRTHRPGMAPLQARRWLQSSPDSAGATERIKVTDFRARTPL